MMKFGVLGALVWIAVALANPIQAAPLTLDDLDANTDAVVQIEDVSPGNWELSFIANVDLIGVTAGIADKASVSGAAFSGQADNFFSFLDTAFTNSFVFSASGGLGVFAANIAQTIASFTYTNGMPRFDNTDVEATFGPLLFIGEGASIPLARVEFRVVPEPSVLLLLGASLAGLAFLRRRPA